MARDLRRAPDLYTIPAGVSFVDSLAAGLMARYGSDGDPAALGRVTVLLPTRRAARSLREAFLRLGGGRAMILPNMNSLGDVDEDELLFFAPAAGLDLDMPPSAPPLWRQIMLTRLVQKWQEKRPDGAMHPAQAAVLARELARFLDQVATQGLTLDGLTDLVDGEFAQHWQITLDFLDILRAAWPDILAEAGYMDPAARQVRLGAALVDHWREQPPADPVIAAGSTGSMPTTARLLAMVARLPEGAVVLPGLDLDLDDESWDALEPTHPQYTMKQLLDGAMGAVRAEVKIWSNTTEQDQSERQRLIREALRPALTTTCWPDIHIDRKSALSGLSRFDTPGPREEAGLIALLMREALETPDRTAALVTPDRTLARRVAGELGRWNIDIDDSAGRPLPHTPPGSFLTLVAEMVADGFAPLPVLACLKHPLATVGRDAVRARTLVRDLERHVLRGPRPGPGTGGIARAVDAIGANGSRQATPERQAAKERLQAFWADVATAVAGFDDLIRGQQVALSDLVVAHVRAAEALAAIEAEDTGADRLWVGEAGEAAAAFMEDLMDAAGDWRIAGEDYPALFTSLMSGRAVRPRHGRHPRLQILGPLEARLQRADLMILGGLNEGTWPPEVEADPWMSRPMRETFGLPPLDQRVGLAAHDFAQMAAAPEVVMTRALKVDGTPTVPSRWLLRMEALLKAPFAARSAYAAWFDELDRPVTVRPCDPPAPRPPVKSRPKRLSVTGIQNLMRDPYSIYARHILGLSPLDPIDAAPGAAEKGNIIHDALDRFLAVYKDHLPDDALVRLESMGREAFGSILDRHPAVRAFWWPRFLHVAEWFIATERERRRHTATLATEIRAEWPVVFGPLDQPINFKLVAKADRIDRMADGRIEIIDYKTGSAPSNREIRAGYAPQLPLEALMVEAGAFPGIESGTVGGLAFWRLHGGDPPAEIKSLKGWESAVELAREGFEALILAFARPETPYLASPRPEVARSGDYDHLARVREWMGSPFGKKEGA